MASPQAKLAESLHALKKLQEQGGAAIRSAELSRTHRERLLKNGFLVKVMKGWYAPYRPDPVRGDSTTWYSCYWKFCAGYLSKRFGKQWSLSPEQSLLLHAGNWVVPRQLIVRTPKGGNKPRSMPQRTSLLAVQSTLPSKGLIQELEGLRLYPVPVALVAVGPMFFSQCAPEARVALAMVRDASEVLAPLLKGGRSKVAGRLAGAFRNIGDDRIANSILETMNAAGYTVRESDPFDEKPILVPTTRVSSPQVHRMKLMWQCMRDPVLELFPPTPQQKDDVGGTLAAVDAMYVSDAYHSLSIEGYSVSPELIERVRSGNWNPDQDRYDHESRNVLAARGYYDAFQVVKESVYKVLTGEDPGEVGRHDHGDWYRQLFAPSVTAGIMEAVDLAGYRSAPVYIRHSRHIPPRYESVRDLMPAFFDLLCEEPEPAVRIVLGHFVFVFIHPYTDGNGRMARFLMNLLLAAGGYPWTVVPLDKRDEYMTALEQASVAQDIQPFAKFIAQLVQSGLMGHQTPIPPAG